MLIPSATLACGHGFFEVRPNRVEEAFGGQPFLLRANQQSEVFRHLTGFDRFDDCVFEFLSKLCDLRRVVHATAMLQATTAVSLFTLSLASASVSAELLIVAAMLLAVWVGGGLFAHVRKHCL